MTTTTICSTSTLRQVPLAIYTSHGMRQMHEGVSHCQLGGEQSVQCCCAVSRVRFELGTLRLHGKTALSPHHCKVSISSGRPTGSLTITTFGKVMRTGMDALYPSSCSWSLLTPWTISWTLFAGPRSGVDRWTIGQPIHRRGTLDLVLSGWRIEWM